jgi:DNA helicase-2/ATP-dependent DNA helicase PcrA
VPDDATGSAAIDRLLRGLNADQRAAVTSVDSPLRILAGAGSGKTRVLTHRIAYLAETGDADPARVLAVTFTRKAAAELRERLGRLGLRQGVQAGTFHAIAYAQLRQRWEERGVRPPELMDRKVGFVARLCPSGPRTLPLDVTAEIEWASARLIEPEDYPAAATAADRDPPLDPYVLAEVFARYSDTKKKRRMVDFDDLLRLAARDLEADPVYATARRWRFRNLYVDEFQDVNPLQHRLLNAWLGSESTLCVVGDPNQAIYSWNGADARYLVEFDRFFPGGSTVTLRDNYRSTPEILTTANAVLAAGHSRVMALRANRAPGEAPTIREFTDEKAEAAAVVRSCRDHRRPGDPWRAQAVLVRTNSQAAAFSEAFGAAGIPHKVRGAGSLLDQPEIRELLGRLRSALSVGDFLADCDRLSRSGTDRDTVDRKTLDGETTYPAHHLNEERRANISELVRLGNEYLALDPTGSTGDFSSWLHSTLRDTDHNGDAVEIVTFHAAKGLEWSIVHVAGLEKGYVPIHHSHEDPEATEEERRLLYVALTRARDQLHCTYATSRTFGSRTVRRTQSPWLDDIRTGFGPPSRAPSRDEVSRNAATARSSLRRRPRRVAVDDLTEADAALFESLRSWRRIQASKADVPAYVVFGDATLRAVASERPTSRSELLDLPGIGAVKAERFGSDLLRLVIEANAGSFEDGGGP